MRSRGAFVAAALLLARPAEAEPEEAPAAAEAHAPRPAPPPATGSVPTDDDEPGPPCEAAYIERVYKATKPSVVRITRPDGALGTGFVFHSPRHVATALHVVDLGRDLRVEFPSGKTTTAVVVAVDAPHDLAILELATPSEAPPLAPRFFVGIGSPVVAIGNPYGDLARYSEELAGLLNYSISQGIVSAKSAAYVQTDAVLSPGNSGGPMLTCDGKIVAVADRLLDARIGFGVPVLHLAALAEKIGTQGTYRGQWSPEGGSLGGTWQRDANGYLGVWLGGSMVGYDRIAITARLGVAFAGKGDTAAPVTDRPIYRGFGELTVGHRWLFFPYRFPTYLTVAGGLFGTFDRGTERRLGVSATDPGQLVARETHLRGGGIAPLGEVVLQLASIDLGYGFALDVLHPAGSTHRLLLGLRL